MSNDKLKLQENINLLVNRFYATFKDDNLRAFVYGKPCFNDEEGREELAQTLEDIGTAVYNLFYGIINIAFISLVARFTNIITKIKDPLADDDGKDDKAFCEERIEDAIFGLYDTYDASDDIVHFVVYNTALAMQNNEAFRDKLGENFYTRKVEGTNGDGSSENLLTLLRWVASKRMMNTSALESSFIAEKSVYIDKLNKLLSYVSFCKYLSLRTSKETKYSVDIGYFDEDTYKTEWYPTNRMILLYDGRFYLLRSMEAYMGEEGEHLTMNYSFSNAPDTQANTTFQIFKEGTYADSKSNFKIYVDSIGKVYNRITFGLLRKRCRSSFCGGLAGYKYYSELAAAVLDALESLCGHNSKKVVNRYIMPLITKNFSVCRDECVCTGTKCKPETKARNERKRFERPCNDKKSFDSPEGIREECVSEMRLLSILTLLFTVSGCKAILPRIFDNCDEGAGDLDQLMKNINGQLRMRFPAFDGKRVDEKTNSIYGASKNTLSFNLADEGDLPGRVRANLSRLKAKAYTESLVWELENITSGASAANGVDKLNANSYSLSEKLEAIDAFHGEDDKRGVEFKYAIESLKRAVITIVCYNEGLKACWEPQFEYEVKVEGKAQLGDAEALEEQNKIISGFFIGAKAKAEEINLKLKNNATPFKYLFSQLFEQNNNIDMRNAINLLLGRDVIDKSELENYVKIEDGNCIIMCPREGDVSRYNLDDFASGEIGNRLPYQITELFRGIASLLGYLYNRNQSKGKSAGLYPQVLTFTNLTTNRDGGNIRKFVFMKSDGEIEKEYNVFTHFNYYINKRYFFVPPRKFENSNWLTHPILVQCARFQEEVFGRITGDKL